MTTTTTIKGPATAEQMHTLHRVLVAELTRCLRMTEKGRSRSPTAATLSVTRALLSDNGQLGLAQDDADRKRLQAIYRNYVAHLGAALADDRPTAAMLSEARLFLAEQGITKDVQGALSTQQALQVLTSAKLPFATH